ncbi:Glutamate synthase [NADPH] small chain [bacterium HR40]|nr:Glutamate synthase [NADPH] small chain [bacterium HR40]
MNEIEARLSSSPASLAEQLPPFSDSQALHEAARCLYCYDAPCTHACPTHIDVATFIRRIATGDPLGAAKTILEANILGHSCARVCPVEELCVGACVLHAEGKPIAIGRLQRFATDHLYARGVSLFRPGPPSGRRVAVVGAGPAGLSCAAELAKLGHAVTVFEKRELAGGLSTYGIIGLREPVAVALAEVEMIRRLGVAIVTGRSLGEDLALEELRRDFEAVFLAIGLGGMPRLGIPGEDSVVDGLSWIERSKLDPASLRVGKEVVVIGAGNTAIDAATVAVRLGAERVTIVYRRSRREMPAYDHEYGFARLEGIDFRFLTQPVRVLVDNGTVRGLACVRMRLGRADASGRARPEPVPGSEFVLPCDQVIAAIGQNKVGWLERLGIATENGFVRVDEEWRTSLPGVWAGGDCIRARGAASTVMAVEDGKRAARAIHRALCATSAAAE